MQRSLPKTLESQGIYIDLLVMISTSWCNAPRGSLKDRGIFLGCGLSCRRN